MAELAAKLRRNFERRVRWLLAEGRRLGGSEAAGTSGTSDAAAAWSVGGVELTGDVPRAADAQAIVMLCVLAAH